MIQELRNLKKYNQERESIIEEFEYNKMNNKYKQKCFYFPQNKFHLKMNSKKKKRIITLNLFYYLLNSLDLFSYKCLFALYCFLNEELRIIIDFALYCCI